MKAISILLMLDNKCIDSPCHSDMQYLASEYALTNKTKEYDRFKMNSVFYFFDRIIGSESKYGTVCSTVGKKTAATVDT